MSNTYIIVKQVTFLATEVEVWDLLTNPGKTKQYMYGCEVLSQWVVGAPILWKGTTESGQEIIHVKGEITEIIPGKKVSFTMLDPNINIEDIPENYVHLTYELSSAESGTQLQLTQDFTGTENAETRYSESIQGWDMVLDGMKKLLER